MDDKSKFVIGRSVHCDLQLLVEGMSRTHAILEEKEGLWELTDLQSSNGTFLNGRRIENSPLVNGDEIRLGDVSLLFKADAPKALDAPVAISDDKRSAALAKNASIKRRLDPQESQMLEFSTKELMGGVEPEKLQATLSTLYKVTNRINNEKNLEQIAQVIVNSLLTLIPAHRAFLMIKDEGSGELRTTGWKLREDSAQEYSLVISQTILNLALERGISVLTSDARSDERFQSGQSIVMQDICSVMCVPLETIQKKILGVIYMDTISASVEFTELDLQLLSAVSAQAATAIERLRLLKNMEALFFSTVRAMVAAIEAKDEYTSGHSERVTHYSVELAREIGFPKSEIFKVKLAGLLHDVGKIGVPVSILNKPGKLTAEEWKIMKSHPEMSELILSKIKSPDIDYALQGAVFHHEKMDGSGYPKGLKGDEIPLIARIIAVADAYDAMTSNRRYQTKRSADEVTQEFVRCKSTHFDPDLTDSFVSMIKNGKIKPMLILGEEIYNSLYKDTGD